VGVDEIPKLDIGDVAGALVGSVSRSPAAAKELAKWKIPMVSVAGDQEIPWLPWRVRSDDLTLVESGMGFRMTSCGLSVPASLGGNQGTFSRRGRSVIGCRDTV
jgi:hypothetical protein